ncbi:hypothetical protein ACVWY5_004896 [Bradyrhizobium sp. USDA 3256]
MQDYSSHFLPVHPFAFGLQKANVRNDVLYIVRCRRWLGWSQVSHIRIERRSMHNRSKSLHGGATICSGQVSLKAAL